MMTFRSWKFAFPLYTLTALIAGQPAMALPPYVKLSCQKIFDIHYRPQDKFGSEFTVTNQAIIEESVRFTGQAASYMDQMLGRKKTGAVEVSGGQGFAGHPIKTKYYEDLVALLKEKCKATGLCKSITKSENKPGSEMTRFDFHDGFYFWVGSDAKCLEFGAKPFEVGATDHGRLQEWIFDPSAKLGLFPHEEIGAGHISVSRAIFNENTRHLKNFHNDFQNRPEIFWAFGSDLRNAAMVAALKPHQIEAFERIDREVSENGSKVTMNDYMDRLEDEVFTEPYGFSEWKPGFGAYYVAFNMNRARGLRYSPKQQRFEFRGIRPQENAYQYKLQISLLERWIQRVGEAQGDIPFIRKDRYGFTHQEVVDGFAALLKDLDLPYEIYRQILPPHLRTLEPSTHPRAKLPYRLKGFREGRGIRKPLPAANTQSSDDKDQAPPPPAFGFPRAYLPEESGK